MFIIRRILKPLKYSLQGLWSAFIGEEAFMVEIILLILLFPLAFILGENKIERVLLLAPLFLSLIVELLNSAIEKVVDKIGKEKNVLSKNAKDFGSAAVFVSFILVILVWGIILLG